MRTHVDLDENLIAQVIALGHFPSKKAAIQAALIEFTKSLKRKEILKLRGKLAWDGDLDQLRSSRTFETD
jgi:Arc/MetJ family transcription regulator